MKRNPYALEQLLKFWLNYLRDVEEKDLKEEILFEKASNEVKSIVQNGVQKKEGHIVDKFYSVLTGAARKTIRDSEPASYKKIVTLIGESLRNVGSFDNLPEEFPKYDQVIRKLGALGREGYSIPKGKAKSLKEGTHEVVKQIQIIANFLAKSQHDDLLELTLGVESSIWEKMYRAGDHNSLKSALREREELLLFKNKINPKWNGVYAVKHIIQIGIRVTKESWEKKWLSIVNQCLEVLEHIALKTYQGNAKMSWKALHGLGVIGKNGIKAKKGNILRSSLKNLVFLSKRANNREIKSKIATHIFYLGGLSIHYETNFDDIIAQSLNKIRKHIKKSKILEQSAEHAKTWESVESEEIEKFKKIAKEN